MYTSTKLDGGFAADLLSATLCCLPVSSALRVPCCYLTHPLGNRVPARLGPGASKVSIPNRYYVVPGNRSELRCADDQVVSGEQKA